jgi:Ca2+-binding RTX toxin-like protein
MRAVFIMIFTLTLAGMLVLQSTAFAADGLPTCFGVTYDANDPAHILGTNGDDQIVGTSGVDVIFGLDGDDLILGQGGDDIICGGNSDDIIRGRGGADRIDELLEFAVREKIDLTVVGPEVPLAADKPTSIYEASERSK